MEEKKIEYLKKHLEQALSVDNYREVNSSYQELLKLVDATDIPDFAQRVNNYNTAHSKRHAQDVASFVDNTKMRMRKAKAKHNMNVKVEVIGLVGGMVVALLSAFLMVMGEEVFGFDDFCFYTGITAAIVGIVMILIGAVFAIVKNASYIAVNKCRIEVFNLICKNEEKLKYLENVETLNTYTGQVKSDKPQGFGVGLCDDFIYIGEWVCGMKSGVGKLISDDMLITLEGEFLANQANGIVDVQWEDGSKWSGEYKNGLPWNGHGKTIVKKKIQQGTWKNGMKIS